MSFCPYVLQNASLERENGAYLQMQSHSKELFFPVLTIE